MLSEELQDLGIYKLVLITVAYAAACALKKKD